MRQEPPTVMSNPPNDPTTDNKWLLPHSDRLINYEYEQMMKSGQTTELFPEELADRIGRPKEYVCGIIKNAISRARIKLPR